MHPVRFDLSLTPGATSRLELASGRDAVDYSLPERKFARAVERAEYRYVYEIRLT